MSSLFGLLRRKPAAARPIEAQVATPAALPAWAQPLFVSALAPCVADGADVLVWKIQDDASTAVISDQFKANAGDYHQRYAASDHFEKLFNQGLEKTGVTVAERPLILDLGSGSGVNSIVPCMRLFPGARSIATDLSGELLSMLGAYLRETGAVEQAVCVQMDAMSDHVAPGAFDLVTGAAILHHLERPKAGLAAAARALKPGGHAIFFEPFDGYGIMRLAYERILSEARLRGDPLDPLVERVLGNMVIDTAARTDPDPTTAAFKALDDKWLFSRERITAMAQDVGFTEIRIVPNNDGANLYQLIAPIQLRLATGRIDLPLPDWAMDILKSFDAALPPSFKRMAMLEGTLVLTKG
ncbi:class I SAM-dependent methyltransferase [Phenylobacterium sp. LjRoot219]|uniref:class I SAM-dependent methyltransferase n=1 Tax=Phenylobacterium sp. LjRoot219 TaxID=3342283 RepID=UPI003ECF9263